MKDENIFVGDFGKRHYDAELGKARGKAGKGTSFVTPKTDAEFIPRRGTLKRRRRTSKRRRRTSKPRRRFNFLLLSTQILVEQIIKGLSFCVQIYKTFLTNERF